MYLYSNQLKLCQRSARRPCTSARVRTSSTPKSAVPSHCRLGYLQWDGTALLGHFGALPGVTGVAGATCNGRGATSGSSSLTVRLVGVVKVAPEVLSLRPKAWPIIHMTPKPPFSLSSQAHRQPPCSSTAVRKEYVDRIGFYLESKLDLNSAQRARGENRVSDFAILGRNSYADGGHAASTSVEGIPSSTF